MLDPSKLLQQQQHTSSPSTQDNNSHAADIQAAAAAKPLMRTATPAGLVINVAASCRLRSGDDSISSTDVQANPTAINAAVGGPSLATTAADHRWQQQQQHEHAADPKLHGNDSSNSSSNEQPPAQANPAVWSDTLQLILLLESAGQCPKDTTLLEPWLTPSLHPAQQSDRTMDSTSSNQLETDSLTAASPDVEQHVTNNEQHSGLADPGPSGGLASSHTLYLLELQLPDLHPLLEAVYSSHGGSSNSSEMEQHTVSQKVSEAEGNHPHSVSCTSDHSDGQGEHQHRAEIVQPSSWRLWFGRLLLCAGLLGMQAASYHAFGISSIMRHLMLRLQHQR